MNDLNRPWSWVRFSLHGLDALSEGVDIVIGQKLREYEGGWDRGKKIGIGYYLYQHGVKREGLWVVKMAATMTWLDQPIPENERLCQA